MNINITLDIALYYYIGRGGSNAGSENYYIYIFILLRPFIIDTAILLNELEYRLKRLTERGSRLHYIVELYYYYF